MTRRALVLALVLLAAGCASVPSLRGDALREILGPCVQLRSEREGVRKSGSGVVIASDDAAVRSWIVTTRHFLEPAAPQTLWVTPTGGGKRLKAVVLALSPDSDLALVEVQGHALPAARLRDSARLGDEVRVIAFPWGRRLTVVSGIVSQIVSPESEVAVEGEVRMVDASVSYGASGGGVFDAVSGTLVGIVEGYRTARVSLSTTPVRSFDMPVPGETTVLSAPLIRKFLATTGVALPQ